MWLLDASTFNLCDFTGSNIPPYAILSHTWGSAEVSFKEMRKDRQAAEQKAAFAKIRYCCSEAARDGLQYVWVDSCCIDKRSSAELSEAINAMFKWYKQAAVCYVYLVDVPTAGSSSQQVNLSQSRWFTRGWTLQELLAPSRIKFFANDWTLLGVKALPPQAALARITGIDWKVLVNPSAMAGVPVAQRMRWASKRQTTREEDVAYSLMGLFDVSMPILYGEGGTRAFKRLQLEIIRMSPDQSIFAW
ncbi:heterokaryon incompatibility protein-domain-containing protein, partial [Mariannaea sp. PMI_226]